MFKGSGKNNKQFKETEMTSVQSTENRIAEIDSKEMVALLDKLDKLHQQGQEKGVYFSAGGRHTDALRTPEEKEAQTLLQSYEQFIQRVGQRAYDGAVERVERTFDYDNQLPKENVVVKNEWTETLAKITDVKSQIDMIRLLRDFNQPNRQLQQIYRGGYATADRAVVKFGKRENTLVKLEKMLGGKLRRLSDKRTLAHARLSPKERAGTIVDRLREERRVRLNNECGAARYAAEQAIRETEAYQEAFKKAGEANRSLELRVNARFSEWLKEVDSVVADIELLEVKNN